MIQMCPIWGGFARFHDIVSKTFAIPSQPKTKPQIFAEYWHRLKRVLQRIRCFEILIRFRIGAIKLDFIGYFKLGKIVKLVFYTPTRQ